MRAVSPLVAVIVAASLPACYQDDASSNSDRKTRMGAITAAVPTPEPPPPPAPPPPAPAPAVAMLAADAGGNLTCEVKVATTVVRAKVNLAEMGGALSIDGGTTRRFAVKAAAHAATYALLFEAYGAGDAAPKGEALTKDKSIVARLVADGDVTKLYFDGDFHPTVPAPEAGTAFTCQREKPAAAH